MPHKELSTFISIDMEILDFNVDMPWSYHASLCIALYLTMSYRNSIGK